MGAIGGMLGVGGGAQGSGYSGPAGTNVLQPTTTQQAQDAYQASLQGLSQQQAFLQAVQAQGGLQNQTNVYNQLGNVASGQGPNPAQAQLAQATGANVANQSALMAGQRGSSANVGLMARQAAQQGATTQQQAAGQAATLQANQSLNALGAQGSLATSMANQQSGATNAYNQSLQNQQQMLLNSIGQQNNANVGMQSNINSANAGLIGGAASQQGNMIGNIASGVGSAFMMAGGGEVPKYADGGMSLSELDPTMSAPSLQQTVSTPGASQTGPQSSVGKYLQSNPNLMGNNQTDSGGKPHQDSLGKGSNSMGQMLGGGLKYLLGGLGEAGSGMEGLASQGIIPALGDTGEFIPEALGAIGTGVEAAAPEILMGAEEVAPYAAAVAAKGGMVPALVSPGEQYLKRKDVEKVKEGKNPLKVGEKIPGKAKVKGNSYANDTVPKKLEEGGIVIPKSVMESKDPHKEAAKFVAAVLAKHGKLPKKSK